MSIRRVVTGGIAPNLAGRAEPRAAQLSWPWQLDKHRLNVIAYDGIQLGALQELNRLLMAPGQRADVLVQASAPGTYELNAMPFDQGHESPTGPLARVVVAGRSEERGHERVQAIGRALPAAAPRALRRAALVAAEGNSGNAPGGLPDTPAS